MKKLVCTLFIIGFATFSVMAQDSDKKVKMGIGVTPAVNWLTPSNTKKMTNDGSVLKMGIGLTIDFKVTDVIWFSTGVEYTGAGGKLGYKASDTAVYYYKDDAIQKVKPADAASSTSAVNTDPNYINYRLLSRNHKVGYIHIPVGFKLKTKQLGAMTYFGQIGGDLYIKTSAKGDDHVSRKVNGATSESDLKANAIGSAVNLVNGAAHVGAGMEYNISGSTSLLVSVQYRHGIMNFTNSGTDYLLRSSVTTSGFSVTQFSNAAKLRQVVLTVAIMF